MLKLSKKIIQQNKYMQVMSRNVCELSHFSRVQFFEILWTVACQASLSMEFSRQEYWSRLPCPPPGIFLTQGMNLHLCIGRLVLYHQHHLGSRKSQLQERIIQLSLEQWQGLGVSISCEIKTLRIILQLALCFQGSTSMDSTNCVSCSTEYVHY